MDKRPSSGDAVDHERLKALFMAPDLLRLRDKLKRRLSAGQRLSGTLTMTQLTNVEKAALARLLGKSLRDAPSVRIGLDELGDTLRAAGIAPSLHAAVTALFGPLDLERAAALKQGQDWNALLERPRVGKADRPEVGSWIAALRREGLLSRLARGDLSKGAALMEQALGLLEHLPANGLTLAELAVRVAGDSHAMDKGEPLGSLALRLVALCFGGDVAPLGDPSTEQVPTARDVWARAGVLTDELSAPALVLGLRCLGSSVLARALTLHAKAGEPYRISTRQMLRERPVFSPEVTGPRVYITENPNIVAAAANRLGERAAPLICTDGQEKTAVRLLLDALALADIELFYHGDFDWPGLQMAQLVMARHGAKPWRFGQADYLNATRVRTLEGASCASPWDPGLAESMKTRQVAVHEEALVEDLLQDLELK